MHIPQRFNSKDSTETDTTETQPFEYQMNISARSEIYDASGIDDRRPRRTTLLDIIGSATSSEMNISWDAHLSTEDLASAQAVDNVTIFAEHYKLGKFAVGDLVPKYSEFGLNGITVRGMDAQARTGLFRLQVTTGINQRAVEGDSTYFLDGTFMRYLAAGNLAIGSEKSFVSLGLVKVKDKNESIRYSGETKPQESLVGSLLLSYDIFPDKLHINVEANISDHTRNTYSEEYKEQVQLFGQPIFKTRLSSRISTSYFSTLDLRLTDIALSAKYKRVQPGYTSLGTIRTDNDYQETSIDGRYSLFQRAIAARTLFSYRSDNLDDTKFTTAKLIRILQTGYFTLNRNLSFSLSYSLYLDKDGSNNDSLSYARNGLTQSISFAPMFTFGTPAFFNRLYGMFSVNALKNGEGADLRSNYENYNLMAAYSCNIGTNFFSVISNTNTRMDRPLSQLNINTTELILEPLFFRQRLRTRLRSTFSYTTGNALPDRHWEAGLGIDYRFTTREILSLQLRQTWHNPNRDDSFSEFRWWLNYIHDIF